MISRRSNGKLSRVNTQSKMALGNTTDSDECNLPTSARIFGLVSLICIMTLGAIGNSVVGITLCVFKRRFDSFSHLLILNVAVSDFLTSTTVLPFDVAYWYKFPVFPLSPSLCRLWNAFFFTFLASSSISLCMVTVDIFLAITQPLHYQMKLTIFRVKSAIAISWLWSIAVGVLIYFFQEEPPIGEYLFDLKPAAYGSYLVLHIGLPSILIPLAYMIIFLIARKHAEKIYPNGDSTTKEQRRKNKLSLRRQLALAKTFCFITTGFFVCWYPFFIVQLFYIFGWDKNVDWCQLETADTIVCWFSYIQCCLNPVFYAFRRKDVRQVISRSIKRADKPNQMMTITRQEPTI